MQPLFSFIPLYIIKASLCNSWILSNYSTKLKSFQDILGLKFMISKYNKLHALFMWFNTSIICFLSYFLPIRSSFHLRGKKPFKWTPTKTIDNNNKALSCGTNVTNPMKPQFFLLTNQISSFGLVYSNVVCLYGKKSSPCCFDLRLTNCNLKSVISYYLCLSVHPAKLSSGAMITKEVQHPLCACKTPPFKCFTPLVTVLRDWITTQ